MSRIELRITKFEDIAYVPEVLDPVHFNLCILDLLELLEANEHLSLREKAEFITSLIGMRTYSSGPIDRQICQRLFQWVKTHYDDLDENSLQEEHLGKAAARSILCCLSYVASEDFLIDKLNQTQDLDEANNISWAIQKVRHPLIRMGDEIPEPIKGRVLFLVNEYLENEPAWNENEETRFVADPASLREYEYHYVVRWVREDELHVPQKKRSMYVGVGPILVSKLMDLIEVTGSSPMYDWDLEFELQTRKLEAAWVLDINFESHQLGRIQQILELDIEPLLALKTSADTITIESPYQEPPLYELVGLNQAGIENRLRFVKRKLEED